MPIPNEDIVREVLERHARDISCREAVEQAWSSVASEYPTRAWWRRKSTARALMWEHSVDNAVTAFEGAPGVNVVSQNDTYSFIFDDAVLLRFKKANIQLISSNYPTLSARLFHRHEPDLFGHEGLHRVEVAHVFNQFESRLDWIGVVAREGKEVLWDFELRSGGGVVETLRTPAPSSPAADRVLRPVKPDADEASEDKDL